MQNRFFKIVLIVLTLSGLVLPSFPLNFIGNQAQAEEGIIEKSAPEELLFEEPEFPIEPTMPGRIEGTGTYFEIKNSEYLNVTLKSTEEIKIVLESIPRMISLDIEASPNAVSTNLTIEGLEPNKTYYKYRDSYKNEAIFVSDENGSYSWSQDLIQPHHIWIQEIKGTIFLPDQCSDYGTWDAETSTCTLNQDLTESVEITENNIAFDCNGHKITGSWIGYGIYLNNKESVVIKNCTATNFSYGIYIYFSHRNTLNKNNFLNNKARGIHLYRSDYNFLIENIANSNGSGIGIISSSYNTLTKTIASNNYHGIVLQSYVNSLPSSYNTISYNNVSNNYWGSGIFLGTANSDNIIIGNIINSNYDGISLSWYRNNLIENVISNNRIGIYFWGAKENTIANNIISDNSYWGVRILVSEDNTLIGNTFRNNKVGVVLGHLSLPSWHIPADNNKIYHNNFIDNQAQAHIIYGTGNLFNDGYPSGGNYWSDYAGVDEKSGENQDQPEADGISDTPYTFYGGEDRYPFMVESGWGIPPPEEDEEGLFNVVVILAETSDVLHESSSITAQPCKLIPKKTYSQGRSKEYFEDLLYCVVDYHKENSFDRVNLNFTIYDNEGEWFKVDKSEEEYLSKEDEFIIDAINLATNTGINFSDRDMVVVLHSGTSYQKDYHWLWNRDPKKLWTQTWALLGHPLGYPPYKIIVAEDDLVGAWAHEIGHIMGALLTPQDTMIPDLSKMGLTTKWPEITDPTKAGKWDVMAEGSWNDNAKNPPYMSSYTKEFLGWLNYDIYPKSAYGEYWINSLSTSDYGDSVFRYNLCDNMQDDCSKYYILEARNRNLKTWDSSLPKEKALVLYQVDSRGYPKYGYDENGMMWNQYWKINIPPPAYDNILGFNDGILGPTGEAYRDLDNLVKFIARTDRNINGKYEIQIDIEELTNDSFWDKFRGIILKPSTTFEQRTKTVSNILNSIGGSEIQNSGNNLLAKQLRVPLQGPATIKELVEGIAKIVLWLLLIPLVLLGLLSLLLDKTIVLRWKSEKIKKIAKSIFKTIWLLVLISIIVFVISLILILILKKIEPPLPAPPPGILRNPLPSTAYPDLDLHLYCDDGRHIGMNYETGEYEVQIPEAIVSGNNQGAPEWIFIPESIDNCNYFVSSYSNRKFLEENPEIAQEIEDTTDSYEIYARYIDNETAIYTSAVISESIAPGIELKHLISGADDDIEIGQGILITDVDCDPDTLNLNSEARWITCYIGLPDGYDVWEIDGATIRLNGVVPAYLDKQGWAKPESNESNIIDDGGELKRMVKFECDEVQEILEPGEAVEITITGKIFYNGGYVDFEGGSTIRVIDQGNGSE